MRKVLIVETDLVVGMGYMRTFIVAGFDVERVSSDAKAIEAMKRFNPDVVLINLLLPGNRGVKLIKWIRSESENRQLPIAGYVREPADALVAEAHLAGANWSNFIGRTGPQELLVAVRNILEISDETTPGPAETPASAPAASSPTPEENASASAPPASEPEPAPPPPPPAPPVKEEPVSPLARTMPKLKELSHFLLKTENKATRPPVVVELLRRTQELAAEESVLAVPPVARISAALLSLLKELSERPDALNASSMRTINQTVTFLEVLLKNPLPVLDEGARPFKILGVDDEVIARKAVMSALESVQLTPESAKDPREALDLAKAQRYDLFVLDVNMPGMTGFELCEKLRASSTYKETPVVFVTASDTFDSRLKFARSGGDDFIAKPFLRPELAAKALIHLLSRRLGLQKN